jgi:hypothetical protein
MLEVFVEMSIVRGVRNSRAPPIIWHVVIPKSRNLIKRFIICVDTVIDWFDAFFQARGEKKKKKKKSDIVM